MRPRGVIDDLSAAISLASDGLCTDARKISGAEFYWWDLDNLQEGSQEETAYKSLKAEGFI